MADPGSAPLVDVLVVAYNRRELLRECLASIGRHCPPVSRALVQISVLDNASTDGSADLVAQRFPEVRLIRSPTNLGFARANNLLAATSEADYVMLLNSDTVLVEDVIGPLLDALRRDRQIVIAAPRLEYPDGAPQYSSERFPTLAYEFAGAVHGTRLWSLLRRPCGLDRILDRTRRTTQISRREDHDADFVWATCWLMRRADIGPEGLFDERFFTYDEDLDYCRRARERRRRIVWVGAATIVHIGGASSTGRARSQLVQTGRRRYYRIHHGVASAIGYHAVIRCVAFAKAIMRIIRAPIPAAADCG